MSSDVNQPEQTPLTDLLRRVPRDAVVVRDERTDEGMLYSHENIPVGALAQEAIALIESLQAEVERLRNPPFQPTHRHRRSGRLYQLVRLEDGKLTGGGWYLGASYKNDKGQYYWTDWRRWNEKFSALPNAEQEGDSD